MVYIEEPKEVDIVIAGGTLTAEDRKLIRAMIARQKAKDKVKSVRVRVASAPAKRASKAARTKVKS